MKSPKNSRIHVSYLRMGITAFCVIAAAVMFYFIVANVPVIFAFLSRVMVILQPIVLGFIMAFLVNPLDNFFAKLLCKLFKKKRHPLLIRIISITVSMLIFVLAISVFFYLVIPEFVSSIVAIVAALPEQLNSLLKWASGLIDNNSTLFGYISDFLTKEQSFIENTLANNVNTWAGYIATGVLDVVNFFKDFIIGIIVAVYVLFSKTRFKAQSLKILYAVFKPNKVDIIAKFAKKTNEIFSGFINGKLIDSVIIGILCFVGVTILKIPYSVLISVIVGVTNIIPIFGPYIGGFICGAFLILINPIKCLYFAIFIILLQALDGNVIGPAILGDSTGLSPFWVMFSIILGGGLFGVIGMLIGVPTFATIYYLIKSLVNYSLAKRNLPIKTSAYNNYEAVSCKISAKGENNVQKSTDSTE